MKKRFFIATIFLTFLLLPLLASEQTGEKPLTLEAMISLRSIGTVAISPSGQQVVFDVTSVDWQRNTFKSDVWLADTVSHQCYAITKGPDMNMAAAWSPDGQAITFLSTRLGKTQLFIFRPCQGEAEPLIEAPEGVQKYAWSPDGKSIAFLIPEAPDKDQQKSRETGFDAVAIDTGKPRSQMMLFDLATKNIKPLVSGDFHIVGFSWSPDGSKIAFVTSPKNLEPVIWDSQTLCIVNRDGSGMQSLDFRYFPVYSRQGVATWSPDGRYLGLEVGDLSKPELHNHIIQVYDFKTGKAFNASGNTDHFLYNCHWSSDGGEYLLPRLLSHERPNLPARSSEERSSAAFSFSQD